MSIRVLLVLTAVVLAGGSTLAVMNKGCKSSQHAWCAPTSDIRHHARNSAQLKRAAMVLMRLRVSSGGPW